MESEQVYPIEADTLLLLEAVLEEVRSHDSVLEIGTGCGYIAKEISTIASVIATDVNPHAVVRAAAYGIDVIRTDLFNGIKGSFTLIVFNPPYLPTPNGEELKDWMERALNGGPSGRQIIEKFINGVPHVLAPNGRILLVVSSLTGLGEVIQYLVERDFWVQVVKKMEFENEYLYVIKCALNEGRRDLSQTVHANHGA